MDETNVKKMVETDMKKMTDINIENMDETDMKKMVEFVTKKIIEINTDKMSESNTDKMSKTNMKIDDTNNGKMSKTNMKIDDTNNGKISESNTDKIYKTEKKIDYPNNEKMSATNNGKMSETNTEKMSETEKKKSSAEKMEKPNTEKTSEPSHKKFILDPVYNKYSDYLLNLIEYSEPKFNEDKHYDEVYKVVGNLPAKELSYRASVLVNRFKCFDMDNVELKSSGYKGLGVFAKRNILKGELVTMYPGDCLMITPPSLRSKRLRIPISGEKKFFDEKKMYTMGVDDLYAISGDPKEISNPAYLGHMINDYVACISPADSEVYTTISKMFANVVSTPAPKINPIMVGIIATKDIKKGEELFIFYSAAYWSNFYP